jgi:1-phosphatidylinositol-3-phosphate 5-kinase
VKSLTSFNPFSEEDENEQSSYTLVTSLLSRVKNSITAATASSNAAFASATSSSASAAPVQSAPPSGPATLTSPPLSSTTGEGTSSRRPTISPHNLSSISTRSIDRNATGKFKLSSGPAQPLVSLTPVVSEAPSVNIDRDADRDRERPPSRTGSMNTFQDTPESYSYSNSIPGFPIPDDARSIRSAMPVTRSASVSKVIRRIRGEGKFPTVIC